MKICSKTQQIATFKKKFPGKHAPEHPLSDAWLRHVSQAASRHTTRPAPKKLGIPWQIIHTPIEIYFRRCARRIRAGRQFIVCSTLYVYALQFFFYEAKMTKIVVQHN